MRILVGGSTGVIRRQLMPLLTSAGHEAVGMVRRPDAAGHHVVADALQRDQVRAAFETVRSHAVVDLLTAIPARIIDADTHGESELERR
ncbi:MAG TPA: NAD-dependent epimerase/dehydratase family protein [Streptosporangiaceae bacterium]|nr:NAD-dependent epimerase/dehydratase family protein [Streptosporangiaceae bacterium]